MRIRTIGMVNTLLVSLIVATSLFFWCGQAKAAQEGDYTYDVFAGEAQITGYTGAGGAVILPSILGGVPVTSIGDYAFYDCVSLTSVNIPQGLTSFGTGAFWNCSSLTSVNIPAGVTNIGEGAFYGCSALAGTTIPSSVTSIGNWAFCLCASLTSVNIPQGVTNIGDRTFGWCTALASITIPSSVTNIDNNAFYDCTSLSSVTIPQGVASIGDGSFASCSALTSITIPSSVTGIGQWAFNECASLTRITFISATTVIYDNEYTIPNHTTIIGQDPSTAKDYAAKYDRNFQVQTDQDQEGDYMYVVTAGQAQITGYIGPGGDVVIPSTLGSYPVTSVGAYAFELCEDLETIDLPEGVTNIGYKSFSGCAGLTSISLPRTLTSIGYAAFNACSNLGQFSIPENVTSIGDAAFAGCTGLPSMEVDPDNLNFSSIDGVLYNEAGTLLMACPGSLTEVNVPEGVESIHTGAFTACTNLTSVSLPESVYSIGDYAFYGCTSLTDIGIQYGVTNIGLAAFYNCISIDSIIFPETVSSIGEECFGGCEWLTSITFNSAMTSIYDDPDTIPVQATIIGHDPSTAKDYASKYGRIFQNQIDQDGDFTFKVIAGQAQIIGYIGTGGDVTIPGTVGGFPVTSIGDEAFDGCTGLTSVSLPTGLTSIGNYTFLFCTGLTSVSLPDSLTTIGEGAFRSCTSLTSVSLPTGLTSIGNYTFLYCTGLTSVNLPDSLTTIGEGAFRSCTGLTSVSLPAGLASIGYFTFEDCTGLTSVSLPTGLTSIGNYTFEGCTGLTSVYLPTGLTSIGNYTFDGCTGLTSVNLPTGLTSIGNCTFLYCTGLTSISFPDSLTTIGNGAFQDCTCLMLISLPDGLKTIGAGAFRSCTGLTSVSLPAGLTSIGSEAFFGCTSLNSITFNSATTYISCDVLPTQATIIGYDPSTAKDYATEHGMAFELIGTGGPGGYTNGIHLINSSLTENDIDINGQGVGYAYFKLIEVNDGVITPLANRTITYNYAGYGDSYLTTSDDNGEIIFTTPTMHDSQSLTLNIQSISGTSEPVESQTIDVQVAKLSFEEEWEGTVGIGAGAKVGIGAGMAVGIAEAEAEIVGLGLKLNCKPSITFKNSYDNGKRSLEITNRLSGELAGSGKVGLFGEVDIPGADLDINIAGIKGEATYGKYVGIGLKIDDYDPNNIDHARKIAVYLLNDAATAGTNVVIAKLLELININVYDNTSFGSKAMLAGGAEIGSFEVEGYEPVKLIGGTATTTFAYDKVQESDGDYQYETGYKTEGKISFADLGYIPPIFSIGSLSNDVTLTANHGWNEHSLELETADEDNSIEILGYEESIGEKTKLQFSGADFSALYNGNSTINEFCNGSKWYFSRQDWVDAVTSMHDSTVNGDYSVSTEKVKGIDEELPFGLYADLGVKIILYISGLDTVSYDTQQGELNDGIALKHSESLDIDSLVDANRLPLTTILAEPIATLGNMVGDFVSKVSASIVEGVQNGAAVVVGVVNEVSDQIVNIYRIITPLGMQKSYVIMALPNELSLLSETYVAVTVGEPYIVTVTEADGTEMPEFETLTLEISYDDAMLATAGIAAESALIDRMKMYYWDEEKATYLNRGGQLDKVNKKVTLDITKGGQYILAIDNLGPDIGNFTVSNHTATPLLSAYVTDLSGIDESTFRFSIDGNTLVNGDNFTDHFNYSTSKFSYQVLEPLAEGEHTASIIVNDTSGNALPQAAILQFSVDTQPPTIVEVNIPEAIISGEELAVTVTTSEADRAFVSIAYPLGEGWSDFETLSMTSPSENTWNTIIRNTLVSNRLKVKVLVYDAADNVSASPEVIVNIAPPVSGYTLSGQVLVEGDDLTEGQTHYSGGVTIELKQGEEIKYSTTSSEAADLASNGSFNLTGIAAGDYTVVISKAGYLTRSFALTINSDLTLSTTSSQYLNRIYLLAGDIVSDEYNVIAASDVNYILSQFNSNSTQVGFDPQVDIVKDQYNVISAADVNLMLSNFNKNSTQYPADIIY